MLPILLFFLISLYPHPGEQTDITFDDPSLGLASPYYVKQTCTNIRQETCCEPLDLQIEGLPEGFGWEAWFHPKRAVYVDLPVSASVSKHYVALFTLANGNAACRGRAVDLAYLNKQRTWRSTFLKYPYLTGGAFLSKEEPTALLYDVYPDTLTYQDISYTDNNRGNGVYRSIVYPQRIIYGRAKFSRSS